MDLEIATIEDITEEFNKRFSSYILIAKKSMLNDIDQVLFQRNGSIHELFGLLHDIKHSLDRELTEIKK